MALLCWAVCVIQCVAALLCCGCWCIDLLLHLLRLGILHLPLVVGLLHPSIHFFLFCCT